MTYLIYDAAIAVILLLFALHGWKKGMILTLCSLLAVFVALLGARFACRTFSPAVSEALQPRFSAMIQRQLGNDQPQSTDGAAQQEDGAIGSFLKSLGLYDTFSRELAQAVREKTAQAVGEASGSLARTAADAVAEALVFCAAFLVILVLWRLFSKALNLAARLPVLHTLNRVLGGVIGFAQGALILFLAAWALRLVGLTVPQETAEQTLLLRFLSGADPIAMLSGI